MRKLPVSCHWELINDPLDIGCFHPGTKFSTHEIVFMLKYRTLTLGSILKHKNLGLFTVRRGGRRTSPYYLKNGKSLVKVNNQSLEIIPT